MQLYEPSKWGDRMQRDIDEAEELLLKWAEAMRHGGSCADALPNKALGFIESWIKDNEDLVEVADAYEMRKIKSCLEDLIVPHYRVIHKVHGISYMVWSFPNEDALYLEAKVAFRLKYFGKGK